MDYNGVDIEHPRIKEAVQTMTKNGESKERIAQIVGMPLEVVERHQRDAKKKSG